jgi:hypothetical protein
MSIQRPPQRAALRALPVICALAASLGGLLPGAAQATAIYSNFNPTSSAPVDYRSTEYADASGYCANYYCTGHLNIWSAGFDFTADTTGLATKAFLPLNALHTYPGMERYFRISIFNSLGQVVVQGGLLGRHVPVGQTAVYEFDLTRDIESGQVLAAQAELEAGETYTAYFHQRFGSLSQTHWMASNRVPTAGQATQYCYTNGGSVCAENFGSGWTYPAGPNGQLPITNFLPALALTDGNGYSAPPSQTVPEPGSLALAGLALIGLVAARRPRAR